MALETIKVLASSFCSFIRPSIRIGRFWIGVQPTNENHRYVLMCMDSNPLTHFSQWHWSITWSSWLSWKVLAQGVYCIGPRYSCSIRSIYPGGIPSGYMGFQVSIPLLGSFSFRRQSLLPLKERKTFFQHSLRLDLGSGRAQHVTFIIQLDHNDRWGFKIPGQALGTNHLRLSHLDSILFRLNWKLVYDLARKYDQLSELSIFEIEKKS